MLRLGLACGVALSGMWGVAPDDAFAHGKRARVRIERTSVCFTPPWRPERARILRLPTRFVPFFEKHGFAWPLSEELCNGRDDDCNGVADDDPTDLGMCTAGVGECAVSGPEVCVDGAPVCDAVPAEPLETWELSCDDALDNDCNGLADADDANCLCPCFDRDFLEAELVSVDLCEDVTNGATRVEVAGADDEGCTASARADVSAVPFCVAVDFEGVDLGGQGGVVCQLDANVTDLPTAEAAAACQTILRGFAEDRELDCSAP